MSWKGYSQIIVALFLISTGPVAIDYIIKFNNPETCALLWGISAFVYSLIFIIYKKEYKDIKKIKLKTGIALAMFSGLAALLWFYSIQAIGAEMTSFIGRVGPLLVVMLGVIFLGERFKLREIIGAIILLSGVYIIAFSPIEYLGIKIIYILIAVTSYSINQVIIKKNIKELSALSMNTVAIGGTMIILSFYTVLTGKFETPHINTLLVCAIIPLFNEIIGTILVMNSYKTIDVGKAQLVRSSYPFVVLLYAWILYKKIPLPHQLIGGTIIILGVMILIGFRKTRN